MSKIIIVIIIIIIIIIKPKSIMRKRMLSDDKDEITYHIKSECCKLTQKEYKTRYAWVKKMITWELCKKPKFDHTTKWYAHKPEADLKNETNKILWDFEIQTDYLDLVITKRTTKWKSKKAKKKKT